MAKEVISRSFGNNLKFHIVSVEVVEDGIF